ncbi:hypothetical protein SEVIR_7G068824v4 [Setaria viridis]
MLQDEDIPPGEFEDGGFVFPGFDQHGLSAQHLPPFPPPGPPHIEQQHGIPDLNDNLAEGAFGGIIPDPVDILPAQEGNQEKEVQQNELDLHFNLSPPLQPSNNIDMDSPFRDLQQELIQEEHQNNLPEAQIQQVVLALPTPTLAPDVLIHHPNGQIVQEPHGPNALQAPQPDNVQAPEQQLPEIVLPQQMDVDQAMGLAKPLQQNPGNNINVNMALAIMPQRDPGFDDFLANWSDQPPRS